MAETQEEARQAVYDIAREQLGKANRTLGGSLQSNIESWTDSRSTIIELLQNADDVGARHVQIDLTHRGVRFSHDGKPLERSHIAALCDVRQSTKDVETQTGFKGIGFKAVFLISDAPLVRQGPWSFEFKPGPLGDHDKQDPGLCWYLIPRWVEEPPAEASPSVSTDTLFWLPYSVRFDHEAQAALREKLIDDLHAACMLFLRSVRQIQIRSGEEFRRLAVEGGSIIDAKPKKTTKRRFVTATKRLTVPDEAKRQLRLDDPRRGVTHRELQLAFELDAEGKLTEVQAENALYYVFLPSEEPTHLPFLVQGDFLLDTQRSKLQENNSWNRWLHEQTLTFITEQLTLLASNPAYGTSHLAVIPAKRAAGHRDVDKHLLQPLYAKIADLPLLRSYAGELVPPNQACMAAESVAGLLDKPWLLDNKKRNSFVPEHEGHILKLKAYGAESLNHADALQGVFRPQNRSWLESRGAEWFSSLYAFLAKHVVGVKSQQTLANQLPNVVGLAILTNGGLAAPASVFLQPANPAVADLMARLPECPLVPKEHMAYAEILSKLGVHLPELETLCKKLILTSGTQAQSDNWTEDQYQATLGLLNEWWRGTGGEPDEEARAAIRNTRGEFRLRTTDGIHPAKSVYIASPVMDAFPVPRVQATSERLGMLRDLGATTAPRLLTGSGYAKEYGEAIKARHGSIPTGYPSNHGWYPWPDNAAPEEVRRRLLDLLLEEPKSVDGTNAWKGARANLGFRVTEVESFAAWQTKNTKWIPTNQGLAQAGDPLVWPEDKTTTRLARGILPIVQPPAAWRTGQKERVRPFLVACNIHFEATLDTLLEILCRLDTVPDEWKNRAAATYQEVIRLLIEAGPVPAAVGPILDRLRLPTPTGQLADAKTLYWPDVVRADPLVDTGAIAWRPDLPRRDLERLFQFLRVRPASRDLKVTPATRLTGQLDLGEEQNLRHLTNHLVAVACHHGAIERDVRTKLSRIEVYRLAGPFEAKVELLVHARTIELHAHVESNQLYSTFQNPIQTAIALVQYLGIASDAVQVIAYILQTPSQADEMLQSSGIPFVRRIELEDGTETADSAGGLAIVRPPPSTPPPGTIPPMSPPGTPPMEPRIIVRTPPETWTADVRPETAVGTLVNWTTPKPRTAEQAPVTPPAAPTGRALLPLTPGQPLIIETTTDQVAEDVRREIGKWGEGFIQEQLAKRLGGEFPDASVQVEGMDTSYRRGEALLATLRWHNRNGETGQSPDFILTYADGKKEYIEVKATGVQGAWVEFTHTEWQLARDHTDRFFVYRVWNAGRKEVDYSIITDIERRWRNGEFPHYRIKLQVEST